MASMSLKVDHDQTGTAMAALLSKAVATDASDAVAIEKMKSALMTDEMQRRLLREQATLATQQALAQSQKNKIENYKQGLSIDAANELANTAGLEIVNGQVVQKDPATAVATEEPPVIVNEARLGEPNDAPMPVPMLPNFYPPVADTSAPIPTADATSAAATLKTTAEPDWTYRVNQHPLLSDEGPVPVEPGRFPDIFDAPILPRRLPPALRDVEQPPMPPRLGALPIDLQPPAGLPPVSGVPKGLTYYGLQDRPQREQPGMLDSLLSSLGMGGGTEPPVVDDVAPLPGVTPEVTGTTIPSTTPVVGGGRPLIDLFGTGTPAPTPAPRPQQGPPQSAAPLPPEYFTPPADLDMPVPVEPQGPPIAAAPGYYDNGPAPVDITPEGIVRTVPLPDTGALAGVPPELRGPPQPDQVITLPGRQLPATPAPDAVVTAATPETPPPTASPVLPTDPTVPVAPEIKQAAAAVTGADGGASDTPETVQTTHGPMSRESIALLMRYAMVTASSPEAGVQAAQRLLGTLGAVYNPGFGTDAKVTENVASLRQGGTALGRESVLGTDAAIRLAKETGDIKTTMIADRAFTLAKTPDGRTVATLVEGQPPPKKASRFGDTESGYMRTAVSDLMIAKPDPKTWDATERQDWPIMIDALYGAKVHVAADGTIVVEKGKLPDGVLPGSAAFNPSNPPPPTPATEAPAETQAAPAATPGATPPAGSNAPIATTATPAGGPKKDAKGRLLTEEGYPAYGGYLVKGQEPPAPIKQTVDGVEVSTLKPAERTKEAEGQTMKKVGYTRQALEPAAYFMKLKRGDINITPMQSILGNLAEDTPIEEVFNRYAKTADQREYYRNVIELVKDMSHKDSGADVTKSDLVTYNALYELPLEPTDKDLALLRKSIKTTLLAEREGYNGAVPSETLRLWDQAAGKAGLNLYEEENIPLHTDDGKAGAKAPAGFEVVNGKVVRKK